MPNQTEPEEKTPETDIIRGHGDVEVYFNKYEQIVLKQDRIMDDDHVIILPRERIPQLIEILQRKCQEYDEGQHQDD